MPAIELELGISHGEAGSLFLLISSGYFITLTGSGFLSSRSTHKKTIILTTTAVGLSLLGVSVSNGLWGIRLWLIILGMSAGFYLPSGIATLTSLAGPRHWGKALSIHELAPNVSFVAAPLLSEALLTYFSWRSVLALLGGFSVLFGAAFARFSKGGEFPGEAPSLGAFKVLFPEPSFWIMIALFSLGIGGSLGLYTMLPLYLITERGLDRSWANTLVALSRLPCLGMTFVAGGVTDRLGSRLTLSYVFLLTGIMTVLLGVIPDPWLISAVFLQPMLSVCFFPAGFAALSFIGPPSFRNVAVSLTVPLAILLGGGAIPTGIGVIGHEGSFTKGIVLLGCLIMTGFILSRFVVIRGQQVRDSHK